MTHQKMWCSSHKWVFSVKNHHIPLPCFLWRCFILLFLHPAVLPAGDQETTLCLFAFKSPGIVLVLDIIIPF